MKKKFFFSISMVFLLIVVTLGVAKVIKVPDASARMNLVVIAGENAEGGGPSYLLSEGFEGTGYENSWSDSGGSTTFDPDNEAQVVEGADGMLIDRAAGETATVTTVLASSYDEVWLFFYFYTAQTTGGAVLRGLDSSDNVAFHIDNGNQDVTAYAGTAYGTANSVKSVPGGVYIWVHYTKVAGENNDTLDLYCSSDTTRGAADAQVTTGNGDYQVNKIQLFADKSGVDWYYDIILVSSSEIGDAPF